MSYLKVLRKFAPEFLRDVALRIRERHLVSELNKLEIGGLGIDKGRPWIKLKGGLVFYGLDTSSYQKRIYKLLGSNIQNIPIECLGVAIEIVSRYVMPRSIPGEIVFNPSRYKPLRDPISDFDFSENKRKEVANLFKPSSGDIVLDVGAYMGYGTMKIAEKIGSTGKVIAFEADPDNLALLKLNIEKNNISNVEIIPKAVSSSTGKSTFFRGGGTVNSVRNDVLQELGHQDLPTMEMDVTSIDDALSSLSISEINLVNITINGGEVDALSGMEEILTASRKVRITLAGWYHFPDGNRVCDVVEPTLITSGFHVEKGKLGRVLAWKG